MSREPKTYDFVVEGRGAFPFDMLRYDGCWPVDAESAANMDRGEYRERRKVRLRSIRPPTTARWNSFLWSCEERQ